MAEAALTPQWRAELLARRGRVRRLLEQAGCDAGVIFGCDAHAEHFRYLTNFSPVLGDSWLILGAEERCVLTFQWQIPEAQALSGIDRWEGAFDPLPLVRAALHELTPRRIGIAGLERMPAPAHQALAGWLPEAEFVDLGAAVAGLRRRKSPLEAERLRAAARITDMMLDAARAMARPGLTEAELAAELSVIPLRRGARCAFETTVVSGVDAPVSIRRPTGRALAVGDSVMVDLGAEVEGYQADATRTFVVGAPSRAQLRAWDVVRRAYEAAVGLARPGVPCCELQRAAARIITDGGFTLAHRIGHGIGLATSYEWPSLDSERAPLEPGITICIEPGVYAPGIGNMKLEDDLLITESGCELLTQSDRSLEGTR
ncbi:MAG TPA: Xaa-Pro peptidase family protein [bacterium]|nr:Xaa-Pro peptidase family protein [bacterium]